MPQKPTKSWKAIDTEQETVTSQCIRVFSQSGELLDDYKISDYDDIAHALQTAINDTSHAEAWNQSGATYFMPGGSHTLPDATHLPVTADDGDVIRGAGKLATQIDVETNSVGATFIKIDESGTSKGKQRTELRDFSVLGNKTTGQRILNAIEAKKCRFVNVLGRELDNTFRVAGGWQPEFWSCEAAHGAGVGLLAEKSSGGDNPNKLRVYGGVYANNTDGIKAVQGSYLQIIGALIERNSGVGIRADKYGPVNIQAAFEQSSSVRLENTKSGGNKSGGQIAGCRFEGNKSIELVNYDGIEIAGNAFGSSNNTDTAISFENTDVTNIHISPSNTYDTNDITTGIADNTTGTIFPEDLNDGIWRDSVFLDFAELQSFANGMLGGSEGLAVTAVVTDNVSNTKIDGQKFPEGTLIKGIGARKPLIDQGNDADAVNLSREGQKIENCRIRTTGGSTNDSVNLGGQGATLDNCVIEDAIRFGVFMTGNETRIANATIESAGNDGVRVSATRCALIDLVCRSSNITGSDIDDDGTDTKIVACDAGIDAADASNQKTAANTDTA